MSLRLTDRSTETIAHAILSAVVSGVLYEEPSMLSTTTSVRAAGASAITTRMPTRTAPSPSEEVEAYVCSSDGIPHHASMLQWIRNVAETVIFLKNMGNNSVTICYCKGFGQNNHFNVSSPSMGFL